MLKMNVDLIREERRLHGARRGFAKSAHPILRLRAIRRMCLPIKTGTARHPVAPGNLLETLGEIGLQIPSPICIGMCQAQAFENAQSARTGSLFPPIGVIGPNLALGIARRQQVAIDRGRALLLYLEAPASPGSDIHLKVGPEIQRDELCSTRPETVIDIFPRDDEVVAPIIDPTDDDMGVGTGHVIMVGGDPIQASPEIARSLLHQPANQRAQILIFTRVLRREDGPELMAIVAADSRKGSGIGRLGIRPVENGSAFFALAGADEIAEVIGDGIGGTPALQGNDARPGEDRPRRQPPTVDRRR